jgi:lipopolysaccharide/colanic/teichoic acid biosynthesis glycosyltransferase
MTGKQKGVGGLKKCGGREPAGFAHIGMQESTAGAGLRLTGACSKTIRALRHWADRGKEPLIAVASIALVVLMPLILLTAILVRLLTREPILLPECSIGRWGRIFVSYKFRVPVANAGNPHAWPTRVAEALHKVGFDQLPQLFNVIRGDMSLIGPRPRAAHEFRHYFAQVPECLRARPGMISILQSYDPSLWDPRTEIALDHYYVCHWSMGLDFWILSKIIFALRRGDRTA